MARIVDQGPRRRPHPRGTAGVEVAEIAELPVGVNVTVLTLPSNASIDVGPGHRDMICFVVLTGQGTVDSEESGLCEITLGVSVFVPARETAIFATESGMTLVRVFGGWMHP
jgi:hypothetical protein